MKAPISMMSFSDSSDVHMGHIRLSGHYSISFRSWNKINVVT